MVGVAVRATAIVGVGVGVMAVPGVGRKREARTPVRTPKRTRATTMKKMRRKPEELDDEGVVGLGRGELGNVSGWDANGKIGSGLDSCVGTAGQASGGVKVGAVGGV